MISPAVSIIMAVKNAGRYLRSALDSIAAQTFQDFEVIVVDGGSTDDSAQIIRSYEKVRSIEQVGSGFAEAWNQGIAEAKAPLICFLDGDDVWAPEKLALQTAALSASIEKSYVVGHVRFFTDPGPPLPSGFKPSLLANSHVAYMPGSIMIRRSAIDCIGPFDEGWKIASDIIWFRKLREAGFHAEIIDQVLLHKRVHESNLSYSTSWRIYRRELFELLKAGLDQRRRGNENGTTGKDDGR
jgi:glycosyltransferase involved in cell wall biosynthesis